MPLSIYSLLGEQFCKSKHYIKSFPYAKISSSHIHNITWLPNQAFLQTGLGNLLGASRFFYLLKNDIAFVITKIFMIKTINYFNFLMKFLFVAYSSKF